MRKLVLPLVVVMVGLLGACGGNGDGGDSGSGSGTASGSGDLPTDDSAAVVGVEGLKFDPEEVTITAGETVRWKWKENLAHNVKSESDEKFGTNGKNVTEADFAHTFAEPGTYKFTCTIHSGMDGVVEVEA